MTYEDALRYIEETHKFGIRLGLENISKLLEMLGNPQDNLNIIHIAGTNGKGSTCSFITKILQTSGYNVGLYTSPYLETFTERIRVNGYNIPEEEVASIVTLIKTKIDEMVREGYSYPTEFEIVTAMAFYYYNKQKVDYVVLEVGMGGRYDATNVINRSLVSVITPVSLDHIDALGDTIGKIAYEKAGIIKENGLVIIHPQEEEAQNVIREVCREKNAKYITVDTKNIEILKSTIESQIFNCEVLEKKYNNIEICLIGEHQINNSIVALNVIEILKDKHNLKISDDDVLKGLNETRWPGRIEKIQDNPVFIIDGAHNEDGANSLAKSIDKHFKDKDITLIIGMLKDKDIDSVLQILIPRCNKVITTTPDNPRALSPEELKEKIQRYNKQVIALDSIEKAVYYALENSHKDEVIISAGSLYMIGTIRSIIKNK
jgi:dihydrofolate synthase / folylpolyglutamate synthase